MQTILNWHKPEEKQPENYSFVLAKIVGETENWVEIVGYGDGKFQLPGRSVNPTVELWSEIPMP